MPPSPEIPLEYAENHAQMLAIVRMLNDMLQDTAAKEQAIAAAREQGGGSREPVVGSKDPPPVTSKDTPVASKDTPVASKDTSVASKDPPVASKDPLASSKDPPVTSKNPPVSTKDPPVASKDPTVTSKGSKDQATASKDPQSKDQAASSRPHRAADKDKDVAADDSENATGKNVDFEYGGKLDFSQEIEALSVDDFIVTKRLSEPPLDQSGGGSHDPGELFRMAEQLERDKFTFMQQNISDPRERDKVANERIQISQSFRQLGNEAYEEDKFDEAIRYYSHAIEHLKDNPVLYNNRALCFYKLGKYRRCIVDLDYVLRKLDKKNLDSWLFRAAAYKCLDDHHNYERSVKNARKFNINSVEYIEECVEKIRSGEL